MIDSEMLKRVVKDIDDRLNDLHLIWGGVYTIGDPGFMQWHGSVLDMLDKLKETLGKEYDYYHHFAIAWQSMDEWAKLDYIQHFEMFDYLVALIQSFELLSNIKLQLLQENKLTALDSAYDTYLEVAPLAGCVDGEIDVLMKDLRQMAASPEIPVAAVIRQCRLIGETCSEIICGFYGLGTHRQQEYRLKAITECQKVPRTILSYLRLVQSCGNEASHGNGGFDLIDGQANIAATVRVVDYVAKLHG